VTTAIVLWSSTTGDVVLRSADNSEVAAVQSTTIYLNPLPAVTPAVPLDIVLVSGTSADVVLKPASTVWSGETSNGNVILYKILGPTTSGSSGAASYSLSGGARAYAYSGVNAGFIVGRNLAGAAGAYSFTGQDGVLSYTPGASAVSYSLSGDAGAYSLQGLAGVFAYSGDVPLKAGGDDAFHPGWNKAAWKKKQKREEAITETIEATYRKLIGVEPAPVVVAGLKAEIRKTPEVAHIDYTQEMRLIEWLSAQIAQVKQQHLDELDDEETLLLLL